MAEAIIAAYGTLLVIFFAGIGSVIYGKIKG